MEINALQSIRLFGLWEQPRCIVNWDDLKALRHSWRTLRTQYEFSAMDLQCIQPDKAEWILRGQLTLHDLPDMLVFPINPYTDMGADIGEVWGMRWPVELQVMMGVTYSHMHSRGMTPEIMSYFNFPLSQWQAWCCLGQSCVRSLSRAGCCGPRCSTRPSALKCDEQ